MGERAAVWERIVPPGGGTIANTPAAGMV